MFLCELCISVPKDVYAVCGNDNKVFRNSESGQNLTWKITLVWLERSSYLPVQSYVTFMYRKINATKTWVINIHFLLKIFPFSDDCE